jgi:hypothetical protein
LHPRKLTAQEIAAAAHRSIVAHAVAAVPIGRDGALLAYIAEVVAAAADRLAESVGETGGRMEVRL